MEIPSGELIKRRCIRETSHKEVSLIHLLFINYFLLGRQIFLTLSAASSVHSFPLYLAFS